VRAKEPPPITTSWQEIRIPLEKFKGVDLSHLEAIQVVFEWEEMSGTIYIPEIYFEKNALNSTSNLTQTEEVVTDSQQLSHTSSNVNCFKNTFYAQNIILYVIGIIGMGIIVFYTANRRRGKNGEN